MTNAAKRSKCEILHGVLYPKFRKHCFSLITDDGEEYDIMSAPKGKKLTEFLYEPVTVHGKLNRRSGLKVVNLETENQPPEIDNPAIQTTAFPSLAFA